MSDAFHSLRAEPLRRFKPYPAYKESGVEWLGEIPAHWEVKRLKRLVEFRGGGTPTKDKLDYWRGEIPWVSPKDMKVWIVKETEDKITPEAVRESATKLVPKGAVLVVVRSGILVHSIPVAIAGREVTVNQDLKALIPGSDVSPHYLARFISGMQRELLVEWKKEGATVESLELDLVAETPTPLPLAPEQRAIAAFLDRETARIDALVAKKERLIELLQEKRTALITRAVTKGLDPTVPMKDSGVEWLGEIPAHWTVSRLSTVCAFRPGKAHEPFIDDAGDFVCVNSRFVSTEGRTRKFCNRNLSPAKRNDVLMVMSDLPNGRALAKAFFVTEDDCYAVNQRVCILSAKNVNPRFLFHSLNRSPFFLRYDDGINQTHLPNSAFTKCPVLLPPQSEQIEIVRRLDEFTTHIDALIQKVSEGIQTLREFRIALISAAVTGKIDVREEAA